jgi:hypothetical protein
MEERKKQYEIKTSRNGLTVPVVNGIHLHSIYNPIKEAEAFATSFKDTLKENNNILVLGLGFGYHIEEIAKSLSSMHENYSIVILESNQELVQEFNKKRNFEDKNIRIFSCNPGKVDCLFVDLEFISFLRVKPSIIKHDPSFNLEKKFFMEFLKYKAPTEISEYFDLLTSPLKEYFSNSMDEGTTVQEHIQSIKTQKGITHQYDFGLLAFETIINNKNTTRGV